MQKNDFKKLSEYIWEIPKSFRKDMRVPARAYLTEKLLDESLSDRSFEQLVNLTTLPGIQKYSIGMPDIHEGYGSPIGGVAAIDAESGVISPGMVGFDQNCGMRLLTSRLTAEDIRPNLDALATEIQRSVPSGLGRGRKLKFSIPEMDKILEGGSKYIVGRGYGEERDVVNCEEQGQMKGADASLVSEQAKRRGQDQAGTLGSGNHFLEIQRVDTIFDEKGAKAMGLFQNQVVVMIHTGSRGLGHQNATDYMRLLGKVMPKYDIEIPDRELACAPFHSPEGQKYFSSLACGMNFAWANRQMITYFVREAWGKILGKDGGALNMVYDVSHNTAKLEDGLLVHRKGATRAFPGQPVFIPGSMGTASYILMGVETSKDAFYTTSHGAGRRLSRKAAMRMLSSKDIVRRLAEQGILVKCQSARGVAEEAPEAYKDIEEVINVSHNAGLAQKVARLWPLAVVKGE